VVAISFTVYRASNTLRCQIVRLARIAFVAQRLPTIRHQGPSPGFSTPGRRVFFAYAASSASASISNARYSTKRVRSCASETVSLAPLSIRQEMAAVEAPSWNRPTVTPVRPYSDFSKRQASRERHPGKASAQWPEGRLIGPYPMPAGVALRPVDLGAAHDPDQRPRDRLESETAIIGADLLDQAVRDQPRDRRLTIGAAGPARQRESVSTESAKDVGAVPRRPLVTSPSAAGLMVRAMSRALLSSAGVSCGNSARIVARRLTVEFEATRSTARSTARLKVNAGAPRISRRTSFARWPAVRLPSRSARVPPATVARRSCSS
jgi:hypothetical protein